MCRGGGLGTQQHDRFETERTDLAKILKKRGQDRSIQDFCFHLDLDAYMAPLAMCHLNPQKRGLIPTCAKTLRENAVNIVIRTTQTSCIRAHYVVFGKQ